MNPDEILIKVTVDDPCAPLGTSQQVWFNVSRAEFRDAFSPLPRDRELPFLPEARAREFEQREARNRAAAIIARYLAPAIVEAVGKIDTINGYSPREWKEMHPEQG